MERDVVAVKVIPKNKLKNREEYEKEVRIMAGLRECPNVVRVLPMEFESTNNYYLVMEYCNQSTLKEFLRSRRHKQKTSIFELLQIMDDLVRGYYAIYERRILHQDIKPANICIKDRVFKLNDFGLAQVAHPEDRHRLAGTLSYMSPEKLRGDRCTNKADVYALGLVLYEVMFGKHPFVEKFEKWWRPTMQARLQNNPSYQNIANVA